MLTTDPPPLASMWGTAARVRAWAVVTLKWKDRSKKPGEVSRKARGIVPPDVVHDDVETAEGLDRSVGQRGQCLEVVQVGRDDHHLAAHGLDASGDFTQLVLGARRDDDVGTGFGQPDGAGGADPSSGPGHHRDGARQPESVEDHRTPHSARAGPCPL